MLIPVSSIVFVFVLIIWFKKCISVQSFAPGGDLQKKARLERYGSNFKYTEFHVMSSVASVVVYTVAIFFGLGMLLVNPVSHNDAEVSCWLIFIRFVMLLRNFFRNQGRVLQKSK